MASPQAGTVLLALLASSLFGLSALVTRLGLRHGDARLGSMLSIGVTTAFLWALYPLFAPEAEWSAGRLLRFVAVFGPIGLLSPGLSLFLSFEGNRRLGPTVSATIASTAPLFGAGSAVLVLGERLTPGVALGTLAIVAGVMVLTWHGRGRRDWPLWAALFPLGAAGLRGGTHMGSKFGFAVAAAPFTAALTSFSVSLAAVAIAWRLRGRARPPVAWRLLLRGGLAWFLLTGVLNGLAVLCQYTALSAGRVVVVSPLVSTFPLFTFALSPLFGVERLSVRIFAGVALAVAGVAAVSAS